MESESFNDQHIEQLQQRAAALYLRGEFGEALGVWSELLGVDQANERALEGVRLCEILTRRQVSPAHRLQPQPDRPVAAAPPAEVSTNGAPEPAAADAAPAPQGDGELGELDAFFDNLAAAPPEASPEPDHGMPSVDPTLPSADPSQTMAIDLTGLDLSQPLAESAPESDEGPDFGMPLQAPSEPTALGLDTGAPLGVDQPAVDPPAADEPESMEASVERAAQAELRRRVHQLLAEAEAAEQAGDLEQAERLLQRVLILDEGEARAASMLRRLRGEPEPEPAAGSPTLPDFAPTAPADEPMDGDFPSFDAAPGFEATSQESPADGELGGDLLGDVPGGDLLGAVPTPPQADEAPGIDPAHGAQLAPDLPEGEDDDSESEQEKLEALERAAARLAAYHAEQNSVVSVRRVLPVIGFGVGGLVLLGAIGWGVMALTGGDSDGDGAQQASLAPQLAKKKKNKQQVDPAAAQPEAPQVDPAQLDAWVEQAVAAHEAGRYADALELYDLVLEADPDNPSAKAGVAVTVDVYQRQQQLSRKEQEAYQAFERGDYRTALRAFYRLPDETGGDYTDEIANGWYNLALISLNGAECDNAEGFLGEVGDRIQSEPAFERLWSLSVACPDEQGSAWFADQLSRVTPRAARD